MLGAARHRLGPVGCLADHLDPGFRGEDHSQTGADESLVVGDHDADHKASSE
jgi:hypothetical protein